MLGTDYVGVLEHVVCGVGVVGGGNTLFVNFTNFDAVRALFCPVRLYGLVVMTSLAAFRSLRP